VVISIYRINVISSNRALEQNAANEKKMKGDDDG
jgi:hypothetical protein